MPTIFGHQLEHFSFDQNLPILGDEFPPLTVKTNTNFFENDYLTTNVDQFSIL